MRVGVALAFLALAAPASAHPLRSAPRCPVLPADNAFNTPVDALGVAANSRRIVAAVGADAPLHPDFGRRYGIPITTVGRGQRRHRVRFDYARESDRGPYPIPRAVRIEGGNDRHALIVDRDACRLYELYALHGSAASGYRAGSGAIFDLRSNRVRPRGWTSADAAGLPILPGLARFDDFAAGSIDHALRVTVPRTRRAFVAPARHFASDSDDPSLPPMGLRLRLRASYPLTGFGPQARGVLVGLKRFGMIVADNGAPWFVTGAPSPRWDDDDLHALGRVHGSDFEVVATRR